MSVKESRESKMWRGREKGRHLIEAEPRRAVVSRGFAETVIEPLGSPKLSLDIERRLQLPLRQRPMLLDRASVAFASQHRMDWT